MVDGEGPFTEGDHARVYRSILKICIWPTWERVPLAAVTHSEVASWVARLSAQMGASGCRKSAILLSGIMSAAVRDQRIYPTRVTAFHSPDFLIIDSVSSPWTSSRTWPITPVHTG